VSFDDFSQLVPELTQLRHQKLVFSKTAEFLQQPFSSWMQVLSDLTSKASLLNTDSLSWQQVIDELVTLFGYVSASTLASLSQDPSGVTSLVLG
jgi:hypothetical protein